MIIKANLPGQQKKQARKNETKTITMTKVIELRPDKSLINQNFEKYQFSSDLVTVDLEKTLTRDVFRQEPGNTQDSWLEARIFAFHNHLFKNPFDSSSWYIDNNRDVWCLSINGDVTLVHNLAVSKETIFAYNPSIGFAAIDTIVLTNGGESLEVLLENSTKNKQIFTLNDVSPGIILDSRYIKEKSLIVIAMCGVTEINGKKCSQLVLLTYKHEIEEGSHEKSLKLCRKQILNVKGPVEYAYIEASGDFIHAISQDTATFEYDSVKPVEIKKNESSMDKDINIPKYCWSQDEDSLTVWIKIAEKYLGERVKIDVTDTAISIVVRDFVLIQGESQHRLDADFTTWKREKDTIELELTKHEGGLMWNELIKGDTGGECLPNETLASEIHDRLSHLCTSEPQTVASDGQPLVGFNAEQLEECDLQGRDNFLQRINLNEHTTTHLVMLGSSNHVLFTHKLQTGQQLCLRHDHHGCVWMPEESDKEIWEIRHVDTFPGFGYVEASKTNKKFCVSPPNGSYVAIVEHTRHAFLYEKPEGTTPIARQRIVDLGSESSPIMGAVATNKHLILLTTKKLYRLTIYP